MPVDARTGSFDAGVVPASEPAQPSGASTEPSLETLTQTWVRMPRGTAEERAAADRFYEQFIFPKVQARFEAVHGPEYRGRYHSVIFSVGTSWEPVVLTWTAVRPQRVLLLHTKKTEPQVDRIVARLGLVPSQFDKQQVLEADPTPIYNAIKQFWERWRTAGPVAIDLTSGTKTMTSGAAMAGSVIGADLLYVANDDYESTLRRPRPGSEYLTRVANPLVVFGDIEEKEAFRLAERHDWAGVRRIASSLQARVPSPRFLALKMLASAYERWDSFEMAQAASALQELVRWMQQNPASSLWPGWLREHQETITDQARLLDLTARGLNGGPGLGGGAGGSEPAGSLLLGDPEVVAGLTASLFATAERRAERGMHDLAVLLLYRVMELIAQRRLWTHGVDTARFERTRMPPPWNEGDGERLLAAINERRRLLRQEELAEMPPRISAVMGYVLLDILEDPVARRINLQEVAGQSEVRNYGFLAHGFRVTDEARYRRFRDFVERVARVHFEVDRRDFERYARLCRLVQPRARP